MRGGWITKDDGSRVGGDWENGSCANPVERGRWFGSFGGAHQRLRQRYGLLMIVLGIVGLAYLLIGRTGGAPDARESDSPPPVADDDSAGQIVYDNGAVYEGALQDDQPHGAGRMTWEDGTRFVGEWERGLAVRGQAFITDDEGRRWVYAASQDDKGEWILERPWLQFADPGYQAP